MKTAFATIKGFELMRMFKKEQFDSWMYEQGIQGEIRIIDLQPSGFLENRPTFFK